MKQFGGWYFPDKEAHFPAWMEKRNERVDGRLTYQYHKLSAAMAYVKQFRAAVDVGSHIGTWAHYLALRFNHVHAFEPVDEFRACLMRNVSHADRMTLYPVALGDGRGRVWMKVNPEDTGGTHVETRPDDGDVDMYPLDFFELEDIDFLKLDCEGYEHHVITGARETLLRCRPCVIVEQKQHIMGKNFGIAGTPAVDLLIKMGAKQRAVISGDHILSWD